MIDSDTQVSFQVSLLCCKIFELTDSLASPISSLRLLLLQVVRTDAHGQLTIITV